MTSKTENKQSSNIQNGKLLIVHENFQSVNKTVFQMLDSRFRLKSFSFYF